MKIEKDISLKPYNTFGINAKAAELVCIHSQEDLTALLQSNVLHNQKHYIVGGGSNLVPAGDYDGLIVVMRNKGIALVTEKDDVVCVEAQAGEVWDDFVHHCIRQGWYGLENLVAIPGTVGASPVQNVGAYGIEAKDVISEVHTINVASGSPHTFKNEECHFAYRNSIFKQELAGQYIVTSVVFKLNKTFCPNLKYKAVSSALEAKGCTNPTAGQLADAISEMRWSKLPRPEETGSAGSFFKNPIVDADKYQTLLAKEPTLVAFPTGDGRYKLSAGWLIEHAGWKGRSLGNAGVYEKQALVLVNNGNCTGQEVLQLADAVIADVNNKFNVILEKEAIILI